MAPLWVALIESQDLRLGVIWNEDDIIGWSVDFNSDTWGQFSTDFDHKTSKVF